MKSDKFIVL